MALMVFPDVFNNFRGICQIGDWLPGPFRLIVSFPVYQVLEFSFIDTGINNSIHFIFFVAILSNMDW